MLGRYSDATLAGSGSYPIMVMLQCKFYSTSGKAGLGMGSGIGGAVVMPLNDDPNVIICMIGRSGVDINMKALGDGAQSL